MLIKVNGLLSPNFLQMGACHNSFKEARKQIFSKARFHAPKNAVSFTVHKLRKVDYHNFPVEKFVGYLLFRVAYYTTKKEGKTPVK